MLNDWQQRFPNCEPIAHWLRTALPDRWVRFHSMPGSKRYPEEESEYATVLERHNRILGELTGSERNVVLLTTEYSESPQPVQLQPELRLLAPDARPWRTVPMHVLDREFDTPNYWHVFASAWEWQAGRFDPIIRLVADEVIFNVMLVSPECRWIVHPYDGGMDVIAESAVAQHRLKSAYSDWLSPRRDGM
jgi:hypothetical protein